MKNLLKGFGLFVGLSIAFSGLTACQKEKTATSNGNDLTKVINNTRSADPVGTPIKYPPVPAAIMTAENKMLDDSVMKLEDKKGKVILVNLWAIWCGPCRREMPHLNEMQEKYKDQGFEVIGLDVDPEPKKEIEDFAREMKLNYPLGWANETLTVEIMKLNKMDGIPQTILINRNGELTGIFRGGSDSVIAKMKETVYKIVNDKAE